MAWAAVCFAALLGTWSLGPTAAYSQGTTATIAPLTPGALLQDEKNSISVFQAAAPATVYVTQNRIVRSSIGMRPTEVPSGSGSGFIWDDKGHIVTNYHVVAKAQTLRVTLYNQKSYEAKLIGGEPRKDIAVLKINAPRSELTPIARALGTQQLLVGQKAVAIGNPFGLDHTLTTGIISALGREIPGYGGVTITDMIQTDASINPGNSGGPLLNSAGQLIGMNTMIYSKTGSSAGIGFAVPLPTIRRIVDQIVKTGRVENVGLGVHILPDAVAQRAQIKGVIVRSVAPGSPAQKAGLRGVQETRRGIKLGDVIVGIEKKKISNYDDLYNALDGRSAGDKISLVVLRKGKRVTLKTSLMRLR